MNATLTTDRTQTAKYVSIAVLIVSLLAALYSYSILRPQRASSLPETTYISQSALEEKYGLRINLMAVTAAGGMVDLRLKIIDSEKAKLLLQDKKNFPTLFVGKNNITLNVAEETKSQELKLENNGDIFLLFPNTGNSVKPGSSVTLVFGNIALDPIEAR